MNTIALIGQDEASLRRLKTDLVKSGFHVMAIDAASLARFDGTKEACLLGIVDGTTAGRLADLVKQVRAKPFFKEIPIVVLMKESEVRELAHLNGIADFLVAPIEPLMLE